MVSKKRHRITIETEAVAFFVLNRLVNGKISLEDSYVDFNTATWAKFDLKPPALRAVTSQRRRSGSDTKVEGIFKVESADFTGRNGFVCKVRRLSDGLTLQATMQDALLSAQSQKVIEAASWSKAPVQLTLSARKVGNDFRTAVVISATTVAKTASK